jgi:hypothetical protein
MSDPSVEKVSLNAKQIILAIIAAVTAVTGVGLFAGNVELAEKLVIPFISGIIGFGAGIVTALWGK